MGESGGQLLRLCDARAFAQDVLEGDVGLLAGLALRGPQRCALCLLEGDDVALEAVLAAEYLRNLRAVRALVDDDGGRASLFHDVFGRAPVFHDGAGARSQKVFGRHLQQMRGFGRDQGDGAGGVADDDAVLHGVDDGARNAFEPLGLQGRLAVLRLGFDQLRVVAADAQLVA